MRARGLIVAAVGAVILVALAILAVQQTTAPCMSMSTAECLP